MPLFDYPTTTTVHTTFVHPEYQYWYPEWQTLRDAFVGEVEIKRKNTRYLPKLQNMTQEEYQAFLQRAVFFNMTYRTVIGLLGTLFRRPPSIENLPSNIDTSHVTKADQSLLQLVLELAREVIHMGRYGILLDMDENGERPPYFSGYLTENIVDWTIEEIDGRWTLTEVILRELRLARPLLNPISLTPEGQKVPTNPRRGTKRGKGGPNNYGDAQNYTEQFSMDTTVTRAARRWIAAYRVCRLEPEDPNDPDSQRIYRQYYHVSDRGDASPEGSPFAVYTPTIRGRPFTFIPFKFFSSVDNTPEIYKSPMLDIVKLNMSHYQSYAQLEHGRFYTAMPVYYAPVPNGEGKGVYSIGPSVVWEVQGNEKPGIIEFNGSGLRYLENALKDKEAQIATLGGRMLDPQKVSAGESNNQVKVKEQNENAVLLNIAFTLDAGFVECLRWWAMWQDAAPDKTSKITFEINKDFLLNSTGAREFRAIQMMYEAGVIPIEVVYDYLKRAEVVPDWMPIGDFKKLLESKDSFPNNQDVQARMEGAPDAKSLWEAEHVLVDPAVVAVRGYDSQAPAGQEPLPGQTQGGPVTASDTAPAGKGPADQENQANLDAKARDHQQQITQGNAEHAADLAVKTAKRMPKPKVANPKTRDSAVTQ